jgi:hypothetical protein
MAQAQKINVGVQADNGDQARFTDFSCSFGKALLHDGLGVPNAAAMLSLKNALRTGDHSDFNNIIVGTPGSGPNSKLNGPQPPPIRQIEIQSDASNRPSANWLCGQL